MIRSCHWMTGLMTFYFILSALLARRFGESLGDRYVFLGINYCILSIL